MFVIERLMVYRELVEWYAVAPFCTLAPLRTTTRLQFPINHQPWDYHCDTVVPLKHQPFDYTFYSCLLCPLASSAAAHSGLYPIWAVRALEGVVANIFVKNVTVGRAKTVDGMIEQCQEPGGCRTLHHLQGARARMMGLEVLDDETNKHPISHVKDELDCESLRDHRYMTLAMMGSSHQHRHRRLGSAPDVPQQARRSPRKPGGLLSSDHLHASPSLRSTFCGHDAMDTCCQVYIITTEVSVRMTDISVVMVCI